MRRDSVRDDVLEGIFRTHRSAILNYVYKNFGSGPPDPDDVLQTVFEKFLAQPDGKDIENPRAFLISCAKNFVLDQRRRQTVRTKFAWDTKSLANDSDDLDAQRVLEGRQALLVIEEVISNLDVRTRDVFLMSRLEGLSSAEIARRKHCSPTLIKKLIAQTMVACHRAFDEAE